MIEVRYVTSHDTLGGWASGSRRFASITDLMQWLDEAKGQRLVYSIRDIA